VPLKYWSILTTLQCNSYGIIRTGCAVIIGKSNMDEFAMGSLLRHLSTSGKNPWNPDPVPVVRQAACCCSVCRIAPYALGSDTGDLLGSLHHTAE
jgi:Asp-tRNA(Asn)/Glu-tRNA(Gln) amidotransferase A subunit family amidase